MSDLKQKADLLRNALTEEFANASPSKTILMALDDMEAIERNPIYVIDMDDYWHEPDSCHGKGICAVCFAGSVMANRLKSRTIDDLDPSDFEDRRIADRLRALNFFRQGEVAIGLEFYNLQCPEEISLQFDPVEYAIDPAQFKIDMRYFADLLKQAGL